MRIAGLQKLTLLDYPGKTAATVFAPGCNMRCPYCHNAALVIPPSKDIPEALSNDAFFAFLKTRQGLLDGVCITGGEALMQPGLIEFCEHICAQGFAIKLDTNGSLPDRLQTILNTNLIEYVAMDIKASPSGYAQTIGSSSFDVCRIKASMECLEKSGVPFEYRTTVVKELHSADDLRAIAAWIQKDATWYLQSYVDAPSVLGGQGRFHPWDPQDLYSLLPELQTHIPAVELRGVETPLL